MTDTSNPIIVEQFFNACTKAVWDANILSVMFFQYI